ncbi:NADH-quinone oxidoreductase subunit C [Streptomyces bauhiniae]|uniref:NADH-quinone oxidoreductase subunit C n=1 Tax=Streptomyces bauhiniae TaxID=2340725 RepID=UPI0033328564
MTAPGWLPAPAEELFGPDATAEESYDVLTVDVPPAAWLTALETARTTLTCTYFDWLSAVDEPGTGFRVSAHVVALHPVRRLLVRTTVPHEAPVLPSAVGVYAGAAWHERETHEMFGVDFTGHPALDHLLLPENFEGHPLRKDFVLAARVAKAWPGAKEPGESEHGGPKRRQMLPPGVPDPNEWGPLKGQLPPAPSRPARGAAAGERPARRARAAGEPGGGAEEAARPRRARSAGEGSASQAAPESGSPESGAGAAAPRRTRSASEGSASQGAPEPGAGAPPRRMRSASQGSASQGNSEGTGAPAEAPQGSRSASQGSASQRTEKPESAEPSVPTDEPSVPTEPAQPAEPKKPAEPAQRRSADAPWHHARPAFEEADETPKAPPAPEQEPTDNPDDPAGGAQ